MVSLVTDKTRKSALASPDFSTPVVVEYRSSKSREKLTQTNLRSSWKSGRQRFSASSNQCRVPWAVGWIWRPVTDPRAKDLPGWAVGLNPVHLSRSRGQRSSISPCPDARHTYPLPRLGTRVPVKWLGGWAPPWRRRACPFPPDMGDQQLATVYRKKGLSAAVLLLPLHALLLRSTTACARINASSSDLVHHFFHKKRRSCTRTTPDPSVHLSIPNLVLLPYYYWKNSY